MIPRSFVPVPDRVRKNEDAATMATPAAWNHTPREPETIIMINVAIPPTINTKPFLVFNFALMRAAARRLKVNKHK